MRVSKQVEQLEQYVCTLYETRDQLKQHIFTRADQSFADGNRERDSIRSIEEWAARKQAVKQAMYDAVGGLPASDTPLHAKVTSRVRAEKYSVECIVYEARPKHYVTANLYLPDDRREPGPAVLFLCGHEAEGKHSPYYHEVILRLVQAGLIVFAVDPIGQGERQSRLADADGRLVWGTAEHQRLGVQCYAIGQSVARYFIHDAMRAIDYLLSRPEVDGKRIGVTGNSGGGTQTAMLMMCDERIAAAAPATFIMNRQQYMHGGGVQDAEQVWPGWTAHGFDHEDILLSFAPKPLLVCAVQYDFFPIEATRLTVERSKRFWEMHGYPEHLKLVEDRSTHRFTDALAIAAADFFLQHLAGRSDKERDAYQKQTAVAKLKPLESRQLLCTESGQVLEEYTDARSPKDEFMESAEKLHARNKRTDPQEIDKALARKVFDFRKRCELNPRIVSMGTFEGLDVQYALWWSQPELMNSGYVIRAAAQVPSDGENGQANPNWTIALWPQGTMKLADHWEWIRKTCEAGQTVLVLNVSGVGPHEPHPLFGKPVHRFFSMMHKLADELIWLGDSLAALRAFDIVRSIDWIQSTFADSSCALPEITISAEGLFRVYAEIAKKVDHRILRVESPDGSKPIQLQDWLREGPSDDEQVMSVIFPNMLHFLGACNEMHGVRKDGAK